LEFFKELGALTEPKDIHFTQAIKRIEQDYDIAYGIFSFLANLEQVPEVFLPLLLPENSFVSNIVLPHSPSGH